MDLVKRKDGLEKRFQELQTIRQRALNAAQQAEFEMIQIQAQVALIEDLVKADGGSGSR